MEDVYTVLVITAHKDYTTIILGMLKERQYRSVVAGNPNEARLKYENESFNLILLDMDMKGFKGSEYVKGIRRKEKTRNVQDIIPILVFGEKANDFTGQFIDHDLVRFLEAPFSELELKKKLLTFSGQTDNVSNNTKGIKKGEYLITEGGVGHEMFWVLSGEFNITKMNHDEQNVVIGKVHPGEVVGEMSFLDNLPRSASVRAETDGEVLVIPHKKFIEILDNQPRWFRSLMQTMSQRLRESNQKVSRKFVKVDDDSNNQDHSDDKDDPKVGV